MPAKSIKNIEASNRERLLNYAKSTHENYNAVLLRFFQERFLARLGASKHKPNFVLKGGFLLLNQHMNPFRPTVDIDVLGVNVSNQQESLKICLQDIANINLHDGVLFETDNMTIQIIKEDAEYEGVRFAFLARMGVIKSKMQIDVGFGDVVPGGFIDERLTTLLADSDFPSILHYPFESIIAEKFQAIVYLGYANSRMKDFYDILFLASNNTFTSKKMNQALAATFAKRKTNMDKRHFIYSEEYISAKTMLWKAFLRKINSGSTDDLTVAILKLKVFIEPALQTNQFNLIWKSQLWQWDEN